MSKHKCILLRGGRVLTPAGMINNGALLIRGHQIVFVGSLSDLPDLSEEYLELDTPDSLIVPGFVDIHIHGVDGADAMDGSHEALDVMSRALVRYGTTSFLPTTMTGDRGSLRQAARAVSEAATRGTSGANLLGMHLEGPFISINKKGVQNPEYARLPDIAELEDLIELSGNRVRLVSIAPELPGALRVIERLTSRGITVSVGHSNATFADVMKAVNCGLDHATHTFNGMKGFCHREPGTVGAVLALQQIKAEVIADMIHVDPIAIRVLVAAKGVDRVILISDAIRAVGMPDGEYDLGGLAVTVTDGEARLQDGTLAGTTLTIIEAIRNMVDRVGVCIEEALQMATINPARSIGCDDRKGSLVVGKDADVTVLSRDLRVQKTIVMGKVVYDAVGETP